MVTRMGASIETELALAKRITIAEIANGIIVIETK
jgi:hypothetical protein